MKLQKILFVIISIFVSFSAFAIILSDYPLLGATTCPMIISSGGGATVRCIKVTVPSSTCSLCGSTPPTPISIKTDSYLLPANGSTIHYSLNALSAGYQSATLCPSSCSSSSALKILLYSNTSCTNLICQTNCGTGVTCSGTHTFTGCPSTTLTCV